MNKLNTAEDPKPKKKTDAELKRECYLRHKDTYLEKARLWREANREKKLAYMKDYKQKIRKRLRGANVKSIRSLRLKDVFCQFAEYSKDRYDEVTVRLRITNMKRFFDYLELTKDERKKICYKFWKEEGRFPTEEEAPDIKGLKNIKYVFELERDFIIRYIRYVNSAEMSNRTGLLLSQPEKESRLSAFKTFLRFCHKKGFIAEDLSRFVIVPQREKKVLKRVLTVEEMERLFDAPDTNETLGIRNRAILELAYSGLRADELLSLKLENADAADNRIMILNSKGDKDRVVPMTEECIYWMKRWLARRQEFVKDNEDPGYVFITQTRNPVLNVNLSRWLKVYAKDAGIPLDISPHDLRRTTATHLAKNGAPIRQIQALLGHSSLQVTTKYLRLADDEIKEEYIKSHPSNRRSLHYGHGTAQRQLP